MSRPSLTLLAFGWDLVLTCGVVSTVFAAPVNQQNPAGGLFPPLLADESLGSGLEIDSAPGPGTTVRRSIPVREAGS